MKNVSSLPSFRALSKFARRLAAAIFCSHFVQVGALISLTGLFHSAAAQTREWTWMGGSSTMATESIAYGQPGVYGTLGMPAAGNIPGGRQSSATWTDSGGNLWLFGGYGIDSRGQLGYLNDLWQFNPLSNEWTWVGGSSTVSCGEDACTQPGRYGTLGEPAIGNIPSGREAAATWVDKNGHVWLFGGDFEGQNNGQPDSLNDLWEFNPATNEWMWVSGSSSVPVSNSETGRPGIYGTLGTPAPGNVPGGRDCGMNWIDQDGNLWLAGNWGYGANGNGGFLSDVWRFNLTTKEWTWMGGSDIAEAQDGAYGTFGQWFPGNSPGTRYESTSWSLSDGNSWLFGGFGTDSQLNYGYLNDTWEYEPASNHWIWEGGSSKIVCEEGGGQTNCGDPGIYGNMGTPAVGNTPGGRDQATGWTDGKGNLWLFGGYGYADEGIDPGELNELWEFFPASNEWASMGGGPINSYCEQCGVYGVLGTPASTNMPGARYSATGWTDASGNLWLFGGFGYGYFDTNNTNSLNPGYLNDLWRYQLTPSVAAPTFSSASGTFSSTQKVSISDKSNNATIFYTLDGTAPTSKSTKYSAVLAIAETTTVKAVAVKSGFTPSVIATATYTIHRPQTIQFTAPASPVAYGIKPITLVAKSTSGLSIIFNVVSGPAKISGSTLIITGAGTVVVAASQPGNANYLAAAEVSHTIVVDKAAQTITFTPLTSPVTYGAKEILLEAKTSSGLPVTISVVSGPAVLYRGYLFIKGAGTVVVAANQAGNSDYAQAAEVKQAITVEKAKLTVTANNLSMKQGAAVPALTYSITGFVNGDTEKSANAGAPRLTTTATSKSAPGAYPIYVAAGTLASANYIFALVSGTLTVTK
jgi:hypothetical protein